MPTPPLKPGHEKWSLAVEAYDLVAGGMTQVEVAGRLGFPRQTVIHWINKVKEHQELDPAMSAIMDVEGTGLVPQQVWKRGKDEDGNRYTVHLKPESKQNDPTEWVDAIVTALSDINAPEPAPLVLADENLCAVFPVADLHIGLLTDQEEVGEDWDSKKAAKVFSETFGRLVSVTPSAGTAILAQLGDLTHTDDQRNVTPQSGHQLDADSRFFMILRRAVASMKWAIEALRRKYGKVIYRGCRGNHDLTAHHAVTLALSEHYRDVDGVEIIDNAGEFYAHEFGSNMLLLHHGDKAKPERLVHFAAAEWPELWGRTKHRVALSGHVHHETRKEIGGMVFESVGTIIPRDFHAHSHAYSAKRGLVSMTLDKAQGEINRARVGV